jgi:aldose 1-epimerase
MHAASRPLFHWIWGTVPPMTIILSRRALLSSLAALPLAGCAARVAGRPGVTEQMFGQMPDGSPVTLYTLSNGTGASLRVMTYGAAVTNLIMPDKAGNFADIVLGLDDFESYRTKSRNFGTLVGRYAGRIGNGRFPLDGREVVLDTGGSKHSSHGGPIGFAKRNWQGQILNGAAVRMTLLSAGWGSGVPRRTGHQRHLQPDTRQPLLPGDCGADDKADSAEPHPSRLFQPVRRAGFPGP